jgi:ABC-type polysaccharide/polyol phosphate export systems, permease component
MKSLFRDLLEGFRHPQFWAFSAWLDIVARYRMSRLGVLWLLLPSTLYIWGVGSFFALLQGHSIRSFAVYIAVGTVIFRLMTSVITDSATVYLGAKSFIMDGHMRLSDFVLRAIAKALFAFLMSMPAAAIALWVFPGFSLHGLALGMLAFPLVLVNMLWIGVVFSLIGARFPDLSQLIGNVFMFLYLLTPIIWSANSVPPGSSRANLVAYNPFYHLIEIVRAPIIGDPYHMSSLYICCAMAVVGWVIAILAYRYWSRFVPIWI